MSYYIYDESVELADLDLKKVKSIARRISKAAKEAESMGVHIFGGSSNGTLRFDDGYSSTMGKHLIIADLGGWFDGGCGACDTDENGYLRGE